MKKLNTSVFILVLFLIAVGCTNEADYDQVIAGGNSKVYIKTYDKSSKGLIEKSLNVVSTPVGVTGNSIFKLPVSCTEKVNSPVKVTVSAKNNLVDSYNQVMNTSYKEISSEAINIENGVVTIPEGMDSSSDSVKVSISKEYIGKMEDGVYLLPLAITGLDRTDIVPSTNLGVLYLKLIKTSDRDNIWDNADIATLPGSWVTDKSGWTGSVPEGQIYGNIKSIWDGNKQTFIFSVTSGKASIIVDLGKEFQTISAIQFSTYSTYYSLARVNVWDSKDGTTWNDNGTAVPFPATNQAVVFYKPLSARFIKLEIYNVFFISEFDIRTP